MLGWYLAQLFLQYVHFLQRKYSIGSFNLLGHTAPAQAASLLLVGPFMDYWLTGKRVDAYGYGLTSTVSFSISFLVFFFFLMFCCEEEEKQRLVKFIYVSGLVCLIFLVRTFWMLDGGFIWCVIFATPSEKFKVTCNRMD